MKIPRVSAKLIARSTPLGSYGLVWAAFSSRRWRSASARVAGSCANATSVSRHDNTRVSTLVLSMARHIGRVSRIGSASCRCVLNHRRIECFNLLSQSAIPGPHAPLVRFLQRTIRIPPITGDAIDGDERARTISPSFAMDEDRTRHRPKDVEETPHCVGRDATGPVEDIAVLDRD